MSDDHVILAKILTAVFDPRETWGSVLNNQLHIAVTLQKTFGVCACGFFPVRRVPNVFYDITNKEFHPLCEQCTAIYTEGRNRLFLSFQCATVGCRLTVAVRSDCEENFTFICPSCDTEHSVVIT